MNDLLVAVPSRGRPQNITRLIDAMRETCTGDTHLVVGLDHDDPRLDEYLLIAEQSTGHVIFDVQAQGLRQVVALTNFLTVPRAPYYRFVGHIGDDNVPRTIGWDSRIIETLEQKGGICFGDDLYPGREKGTLTIHAFMDTQIVRTLGYFGPPEIKHMYVDVVWQAWGEKVGLTYLSDVIIEHLHYTAGKAQSDESYQASTGLIPTDLANFNAYCDSGRLNADLAKLGAPQYEAWEMSGFRRKLNVPHTRPDGTYCSGWNDPLR